MRSAGELLAVPIRHEDIELGRAVDVLVDLDAGRALGLEVRCGDDARRFLPFGAARLGRLATEVGSPLALLDDVGFYRARGTGLRELRGATVTQIGRPLGTLADLLLADDAAVAGVVLDGPRPARVPYGPGLAFALQRRVSAA